MSELMDVVDKDDNVIGISTQENIYINKPLHRIVHLMIFNSKGEFVLQLRSKNKSYCPLHWSTAAGGHPLAGENYEEAIIRESKEELGIKLELINFKKLIYTDHSRNITRFLGIFESKYDGDFNISNDEVESIKCFSHNKLQQMINNGEKFHPELLFILKNLYQL